MTVRTEPLPSGTIIVDVFRSDVIDSANALEQWLREHDMPVMTNSIYSLGGSLHPVTGMPCAFYRIMLQSETDAMLIKTALG